MKQVLVLLACVGLATTLHAEIGPSSTVAERAKGAGRVVVAEVLDVQSRFATNQFGDQLIVSDVVLSVVETLKGPAAATATVTVEGGTVGDLTLTVSDLPSLKSGDRHDRGKGILRVSKAGTIEGSSVTLDNVRGQVIAALKGNQ
jgi:hypothetical protein